MNEENITEHLEFKGSDKIKSYTIYHLEIFKRYKKALKNDGNVNKTRDILKEFLKELF